MGRRTTKITLKCDAPECGWHELVPFNQLRKHVDRACPRCTANVLTKDDLALAIGSVAFLEALGAKVVDSTESVAPKGGGLVSVNPHAGEIGITIKVG